MMRLDELARRARLLVHQGGVTLSAAALALGIPQVILARFHENGLAGRFVERQGLGVARRLDQADRAWIIDTIDRARRDDGLLARSRDRAGEFRRWFGEDPTAVVATLVAQRLGLSLKLAAPAANPRGPF